MAREIDPHERPLVRWATHFVMALLLVGTPFVEWMMVRNLLHSAQSTSWPKVSGVITKSEVVWDLRGKEVRYSADVAYDYEVRDKPYHGSSVRVGNMTTKGKADAEQIVARFPAGRPVAVYYNPDDPSETCLIPGTKWVHYLVVVTPVFFFLLSVVYFRTLWARRAK